MVGGSIYNENLELYYDYKDDGKTSSEAQHEIIATRYINLIAAYVTSQFPDFDWDRAEAIAWGGLTDTDAYKNKSKKEKRKIDKILNEEKDSSDPNSEGTGC